MRSDIDHEGGTAMSGEASEDGDNDEKDAATAGSIAARGSASTVASVTHQIRSRVAALARRHVAAHVAARTVKTVPCTSQLSNHSMANS
jgi:hypothetical protein